MVSQNSSHFQKTNSNPAPSTGSAIKRAMISCDWLRVMSTILAGGGQVICPSLSRLATAAADHDQDEQSCDERQHEQPQDDQGQREVNLDDSGGDRCFHAGYSSPAPLCVLRACA